MLMHALHYWKNKYSLLCGVGNLKEMHGSHHHYPLFYSFLKSQNTWLCFYNNLRVLNLLNLVLLLLLKWGVNWNTSYFNIFLHILFLQKMFAYFITKDNFNNYISPPLLFPLNFLVTIYLFNIFLQLICWLIKGVSI
jgi:hypothetical protein